MKFLLLLLLVGYVAANSDWKRTLDGQVSDLLGEDSFLRQYRAGDRDVNKDFETELGKKLRETLDHILEKVKDAVDHGKTVKKEVLDKLRDVKAKLNELGMEYGDKAKELMQKIKDRAKNFSKDLLDRPGLKDDKDAERRALAFEREVGELLRRAEEDDVKTEMGKKLPETLDKIMEKIKESADQDTAVKQDIINGLKDMREKIKELKIEMDEKTKEKIKEYLRVFLDKLGLYDKEERSVVHAEGKIREADFRKLKMALADQMLNLLKEKDEKGKQKLLDLVDRIFGDDEECETL